MFYWMAPPIDQADLLKECEGLALGLSARAAEAEELRRLPEATLREAEDIDLFTMVTPTSLGGRGLGLDPLAQATRTLAHGCPASAWTLSFLVMHSWLLARLPAEGRAEVFANGPAALAA